MKNEQQEAGWEIPIPELFLNPFFWIATLAILAFIGYNLWFSPAKNTPASQATTQTTQATPQAQDKTLGYFRKVSNTPVALENKPYFLYVGAQFCPFCAAERWSLVKALSNFGTWSGLGPDTSADEEAGFSPSLLQGKTYEQVKADIITAYLCKATGNKPNEVCSKPEIASLVAQVP